MRPLYMTTLENELRMWEDHCYIYETVAKALLPTGWRSFIPIAGQVKNWKSFRSHLLNADRTDFDHEKYHCPESVVKLLKSAAFFPEMLFDWTKNSRRIYTLTEELQTMLEMTSLKGIYWEDLKFPFPSFAISLPKPIIYPGNNFPYDFLIVNTFNDGDQDRMEVYAIKRDIEYSPVTDEEKTAFAKVVMKRRKNLEAYVNEIYNFSEQLAVDHFKKSGSGRFFNSSNMTKNNRFSADTPTSVRIREGEISFDFKYLIETGATQDEAADFLDKFDRIIAGLMLYFNTLPAPEYNKLSWQKGERKKAANVSSELDCIANEELVCAVAYNDRCAHESISSGKTHSSSSGWTQGPHKRTGYWRRERGQGNNPFAPKTVWVNDYKVHPDQLPPETIEVGLEKFIGV